MSSTSSSSKARDGNIFSEAYKSLSQGGGGGGGGGRIVVENTSK